MMVHSWSTQHVRVKVVDRASGEVTYVRPTVRLMYYISIVLQVHKIIVICTSFSHSAHCRLIYISRLTSTFQVQWKGCSCNTKHVGNSFVRCWCRCELLVMVLLSVNRHSTFTVPIFMQVCIYLFWRIVGAI